MISEFISKTGIQIEYLVAFLFLIQIILFVLLIGVYERKRWEKS